MKTTENIKNLPEFITLIKRYESITIEELQLNWFFNGGLTLKSITGFNSYNCSLCVKVKETGFEVKCRFCVYSLTDNKCNNGTNLYTYIKIGKAQDKEDLFFAIRARAVHMRQILTNAGINFE